MQHHPPTLEASTHPTKKTCFYKYCRQLNLLPLERLHYIDMWHTGLVHHNQLKPVLVWLKKHHTVFVRPRPMNSETPPLTTTLIMTTPNMRGQTDANALTIPPTNGDSKNSQTRSRLTSHDHSSQFIPFNISHIF